MNKLNDNQLNLWSTFDKNGRLLSPSETLQKYVEHYEVNLSWDNFDSFSFIHHSLTSLPNSIIQFLLGYIQKSNVRNFLCPASGVGTLPIALVSEGVITQGTCIENNQSLIEVFNLIKGYQSLNLIQGNPIDVLQKINDQYDLTISFPPIGLIPNGINYQDGFLPKTIKSSDKNMLVYLSLTKLTENGEGIFVLPRNFSWLQQGKSLKLLKGLGFFIHSIIDIPNKFFRTHTNFPLSIYFISKQVLEKTFVSILDPDKTPDELVEELISHKETGKVKSGYQIDVEKYRSWDMLLLNDEIEAETSQSGTNSKLLKEISKSYKRGNSRKEIGGFQEEPNTIYLPSIGNSPVVTKLSNLKINPQNYYQIVFDESQAFSEYVAGFFNSPLGLKIRTMLESGETIPQIPLSNLDLAKILLPTIDKQIKIVDLNNEIQKYKVNLDTQEKSLWAKPGNYKKIQRELRQFNRQSEELFNDWIGSIPFPLASILRRYLIVSEPRDKIDHLLHFFEAFAQFCTTHLLSAYYQDDKYFNGYKHQWFDLDNDFCKNKRASFGNWVTIGERVAKFTRSQLSEKEMRNKIFDLFHTDNIEFINLMINKDLFRVFYNTKNYRNDWTGHGGLSNDTEYKRRLVLLESELTSIRELVKDTYTDFLLVQPRTMVFSKGIYINKIYRLMGDNPLFPENELETNIALDRNELYFIEKSRRDPLKLIRFFRMLPSPQSEQNACYFYSRFDPQGIRYVSYHFETQSEQEVADDGLVEFFSRLSN